MPVRRLKVQYRKCLKCYYGDPPVQMSGCGQILSSSSSSSHSPSLPLTGSPESTSRQARYRRWTDTRPEASPLEREEDAGIHGEQEVHSDHSLTITERERDCDLFMNSRKTVIRFQMIGSVSKTQTLRAGYGYTDINRRVPSHSRKSHWREPSWQTLKHTNTRQLDIDSRIDRLMDR